jgi:hypothetical protein
MITFIIISQILLLNKYLGPNLNKFFPSCQDYNYANFPKHFTKLVIKQETWRDKR